MYLSQLVDLVKILELVELGHKLMHPYPAPLVVFVGKLKPSNFRCILIYHKHPYTIVP